MVYVKDIIRSIPTTRRSAGEDPLEEGAEYRGFVFVVAPVPPATQSVKGLNRTAGEAMITGSVEAL